MLPLGRSFALSSVIIMQPLTTKMKGEKCSYNSSLRTGRRTVPHSKPVNKAGVGREAIEAYNRINT